MKDILNKKYVVIGLTLAIGLIIGWFIKPSEKQIGHSSDHPTANESKEEIWTCSMHPRIRQRKPGNCPICGMTLIPLENNEGEMDPMAVSMSPTAMQLAQVETMAVGTGNAYKPIRLNGKVQPDERHTVTQASHVPGRIERLAVNFTGEFVRQGQVIAYVYSPELATAQEELFEAAKIRESQPQLFRAAKEKLRNWKLTDQQIEEILSSKNTIEQFPILSNVSGYVAQKMVNPGDYIKRGQAIFEIADLSKVWVLFDVYESEMAWIKKDMPVTYTVQSLPGETFNGRISYIDPVIDPKTRVAKARVEADNPELMLKPEMFVNGTVQAMTNAKDSTLTVPKTAVMWTGKRSVVYVMQNTAQGVSFIMREVALGPELGKSYVIESGLQEGEEIAVNGTFSIDAAAQLAGKPSMMSPKENNKRMNVSAESKSALQPVISRYLLLKDALVNDDLKQAQTQAKQLQSVLNAINMEVFEGDAHILWMKHAKPLNTATSNIVKAKNIKGAREGFIPLSENMIVLMQGMKPASSALYVQHCPMADNNQGADWLSAEKEVRNPYFGSSMLSCGEVTDVINK